MGRIGLELVRWRLEAHDSLSVGGRPPLRDFRGARASVVHPELPTALCGGSGVEWHWGWTPRGDAARKGGVGNYAPSVAFLINVGGFTASRRRGLPMSRPSWAGHAQMPGGAATATRQRALQGVAATSAAVGGAAAGGRSEQWPTRFVMRRGNLWEKESTTMSEGLRTYLV